MISRLWTDVLNSDDQQFHQYIPVKQTITSDLCPSLTEHKKDHNIYDVGIHQRYMGTLNIPVL